MQTTVGESSHCKFCIQNIIRLVYRYFIWDKTFNLTSSLFTHSATITSALTFGGSRAVPTNMETLVPSASQVKMSAESSSCPSSCSSCSFRINSYSRAGTFSMSSNRMEKLNLCQNNMKTPIPVNETGDYLQSRDVEGCVKVTQGQCKLSIQITNMEA